MLTQSGATPEEVQARLPQIKTKYKLTSIVPEPLGAGQFDVLVVINPADKTKSTKLQGAPEGLAVGVFIKALGQVWRIYAPPDQQHIRLADVATLDKKTFVTSIFMEYSR